MASQSSSPAAHEARMDATLKAIRRLLLAAALSVPAAPALAEGGEAAPLVRSATSERALLLATLYGPPELLAEQSLREAKRAFDEMVRTDPSSRATEARYPGVHAFVWKTVEPQMRSDALAAEQPTLRQIAALFADRLSPEEIEAMIALASTPGARRLTRDTIAAIRTAPPGQPPAPTPGLAERMAANFDFTAGLTADEVRDLAGLAALVPKEKLRRLAPEVQRIRLEAAYRDEPRLQARTQAAMQAAMTRFIASRRRR